MVQLSSGLELRESQIKIDGFRLQRLEVYNWGTFNQHIWSITPAAGSALLPAASSDVGEPSSRRGQGILKMFGTFTESRRTRAVSPEDAVRVELYSL